MPGLKRIQSIILNLSWMGLVLLLPITSFPLIVRLVGSDVIGYPSGILLLILVVLWYLPLIFNGEKIEKQHLILFAFVLLALFSTAMSAFQSIPTYKGNTILTEELQAVLTLAIGVSVLLVVSKWTQAPGRLQQTIRLLNWSGLFVVLWSFAQFIAWRVLSGYPAAMEHFHRFFSTGVLYANRVTGLTLEPSFFAHQLNMLYLPLWFSATVQKYSVSRKRLLGISFENGLFALGAVALFLTLSRVGYLSFMMMVGVFFLQVNGRLLEWVSRKIAPKFHAFQNEKPGSLKKRKQILRFIRIGLIVIFILVYLLLLSGAIFIFVKIDPRMESVFEFNFDEEQWLYQYLSQLDLGPRVSFWIASWNVFEKHPLFGTGLGSSGFFFMDTLPDYSWLFPEVRALIWHSSTVLNPKNLWTRLLAETGILGFSAFIIWLLGNWQTSRELMRKSSPLLRQMGLMGIFVVAAVLIEGFSVDSFALPYYWFSFGLVLSAFRQSQRNSKPVPLSV